MSSAQSSRDTILGSDFQVSSTSSPTVPSSAGDGNNGGRHSALGAVPELGGPATDASDSDDDQMWSGPTQSSAPARSRRDGSRERAEARRLGGEPQHQRRQCGDKSSRELSPYTPTRRSTSLPKSKSDARAGPSVGRLYGPISGKVPRLPDPGGDVTAPSDYARGAEEDLTKGLWAAPQPVRGMQRQLEDGTSGHGMSDSVGDFSIVSGGQGRNSPPLQGSQGFHGSDRDTARIRATQVSRSIEVDVPVDIQYLFDEEQRQAQAVQQAGTTKGTPLRGNASACSVIC